MQIVFRHWWLKSAKRWLNYVFFFWLLWEFDAFIKNDRDISKKERNKHTLEFINFFYCRMELKFLLGKINAPIVMFETFCLVYLNSYLIIKFSPAYSMFIEPKIWRFQALKPRLVFIIGQSLNVDLMTSVYLGYKMWTNCLIGLADL